MCWGYFIVGDVSYGRLGKFPLPEGGITWVQVVPPLFILALTRFGVPVSTTFLVLTVFHPGNLEDMLKKSLFGYALAFGCAYFIARFVVVALERRFLASQKDGQAQIQTYWVYLQWCATAWLWSQWLVQDLANIFAYLPRELSLLGFVMAIGVMYVLHAWIFYKRGGAIQKIVTSKTNMTDIRAATIIDLQYGFVLFFFKELNDVPMSTTWVFLGLLAGRELALTGALKHRKFKKAYATCGRDAIKALIGLGISIGLAFALPEIDRMIKGESSAKATIAKVEPAAQTTEIIIEQTKEPVEAPLNQ
ncbi:hypothetical protein GCM10007047_29040 [Cerasicoccus arenae]|uniref:Uncharacterized protein n=2 Tax=Cerasicoccus arenae TaxID=424488 RepID=A0A8J3DM50_9BACT|nr:hypothetical protein [Cerasicoccus arenae]GHC09886.1 hypothetical protein GCM10007047_29040 [Cerasicoccus arenae]